MTWSWVFDPHEGCKAFEDDLEYDSEGSDTPSFVSYQEEDYYYYHEHPQPIYEEVPQHYNHGGTYQRNYQQDQEDSSCNKEVSWKDVMDFLKEMKRDQEAHNQALNQRLELQETFNDAHDKLVSQLLEEVAQIEREQEKLASGAMVDEEVIEEALDLSENEFEDLVLENNTTPIPLVTEEPMNVLVMVDEPVTEVTQVNLNRSPILVTHINEYWGDGASSKKRKVSLEDLEQNMVKWPCIHFAHMSTTEKKVWAQNFNYRAYTGNSVGKCSVRPRSNPSVLISRKRVRARCVNYQAYVGNVEGKCSFTSTHNFLLDILNMKEEAEPRCVNYRAFIGNSVGKCPLRPP
ncbi:uncharacterized protein LOC143619899 isoform X2 [Bidens hawaiensis]|uniref:uncharacterized protein LOC143619899 isoform X2 n=1 Tax=Bidens hawaiensis TaxID=980011 RepID=UPI00404A6559